MKHRVLGCFSSATVSALEERHKLGAMATTPQFISCHIYGGVVLAEVRSTAPEVSGRTVASSWQNKGSTPTLAGTFLDDMRAPVRTVVGHHQRHYLAEKNYTFTFRCPKLGDLGHAL